MSRSFLLVRVEVTIGEGCGGNRHTHTHTHSSSSSSSSSSNEHPCEHAGDCYCYPPQEHKWNPHPWQSACNAYRRHSRTMMLHCLVCCISSDSTTITDL